MLVGTAFYACIGSSAPCAAQVVLLSSSVNNGSFENALNGSETGGDLMGTGSNGGIRYANDDGGDITVPGWTFQHNATFGGLNFSSSTQADEGVTSVVKNSGGRLTGTTDPIAIDLADGAFFDVAGAFEFRDGDAGSPFFSLSLLFDDNTTLVVADRNTLPSSPNQTSGTVAYREQFTGGAFYQGSSASTVQLQFVIDGAGGGRQLLADDFVLVQDIPPFPAGDVDRNGVLNVNDFNLIRDNFFNTGPSDGSLVGEAFGAVDGVVDLTDFTLFRTSYEATGNSFSALLTASVAPEPSSLSLLLTGVAAAGWPRGRTS